MTLLRHSLLALVLLSPVAAQTTLYWDSDGATPGTTNIRNTWDYSASRPWWSTSSAGNVATQAWTSGANAVFSAGSNATGYQLVDIGQGVNVNAITVEEGDVELWGLVYGGYFYDLSSFEVASGATAILDATMNQSSGAVNFTKTGAGTLTIKAPNNMSGTFTVSGGTTNISSQSNLSSGTLTVNNGATLANSGILELNNRTVNVTGSGSTLSSVNYIEFGDIGDVTVNLGSGGTISSQSSVAFGVNGGVTGTGVITGSDANLNSGSQLHVGYYGIGNLTVESGGRVTPGSILELATYSGSTGTFNLNSGGTLAIGGTNGIVKGAGTANLNLGGGTIEVTGTNLTTSVPVNLVSGTTSTVDTNDFDATLSGALSGDGGIAKSGAGTLTLASANTHTGGTTINDGKLVLGTATSLGASTGNVTLNGGILDLANFNPTVGTAVFNGGTFDFGTLDNAAAFEVQSGSLSQPLGGSAALTKTGSGTFTLSGNNSYSGGTTVDAGTLILSGANTFTAGTSINGGTLQISADTNLGTAPGSASPGHLSFDGGTLATTASFALSSNRGIVLNGSGGTLNTASGTTLSYDGILAGAGALTKAGAGTLELSGSNTYTGGTTLSEGTLIGNTDSLQGDIINNSSLVFNQLADGTYADMLSGTGSLSKTGAGTLTLSGTNSYSGNTSVNAGKLHLYSPTSLYSGVSSNWNKLTIAGGAGLSVNINTGAFAAEDVGALLNQANFSSGSRELELNLSETQSLTENLTIDLSGTSTPSATLSLTAPAAVNLNAGTLTLATAANQSLAVDLSFTGGNAGLTGGTYTNVNGYLMLDGGTGGTGGTINMTGGNITFNEVVNLKGGEGGRSSIGSYDGGAGGTGGAFVLTQGNVTIDQSLDLSGGRGGYSNLTMHTGGSGGNGGLGGALVIHDGTLGLSSGASINLAGGNGRDELGGTYGGDGGNGGYINLLGGTLNVADDSTINLSGGSLGLGEYFDHSADGSAGSKGTFYLAGGTLSLSSLSWLANPSTFTGNFAFTGGTLKASDAGENLSLDGSSVLGLALANGSVTNARTLDLAGDLSLSGVIAGSGSLTKTGSGTLTLSGANTYSGGTIVTGGTLASSTVSGLGSGTIDISNGGVIEMGSSFLNFVSDVAVTGTNSSMNTGSYATPNGTSALFRFESVGGNNLTVSGGGGVTPYNGVLFGGIGGNTGTATITGEGSEVRTRLISLANSGSAQVTVEQGGTLSATDTLWLGLNASSNATLNLASGGTLEVGGTGPYLGEGYGFYQGAGTTAFNFSGGTLRVIGSDLFTNVDATLSNTSTIDTNAFNATYEGSLAGTGNLTKTGTGNLTLAGDNTFTGTTTISAGTLTLGHANALAGSTLATTSGLSFGSLTSASIGGLPTAENLALTNAGSAGVALTLGSNNADASYSGVLSGSGSLIKAGTGTLTLAGNNTHTGGTTINAGTLSVGSAAPLGGGDITVNGGTLAGSVHLSLDRTVVVDSSDATLSTVGYLEIGSAGTGSLTVSNGAQVSSGTSTAFGVLTATSGTGTVTGTDSRLDADGTLFLGYRGTGELTVANGGTVTSNLTSFSQDGGTGTLNLNTGGTFETPDINTGGSSDALNLGGGTLKVTGSSFATSIATVLVDSTNSSIDTNGNSATLSGAITGSGALTKTGSGNLTLSGANDYSGGTTISAGTLTGNSSSLQGDITNNAALVFDQASTGTYVGNMSGSGSLTQSGAGNLTLSGTNSYSGGTTVSAGTLTGNSSSLQGNITNNAALVFDQASTGTYAGNMSGSGSLTKSGSGNLTLAGTNSYSGGTTVSAGTLTIASDAKLGDSSGALAVTSGAILNTGGDYRTNRAVTVDGAGSNLYNNGELIIGNGGTGSLTLTDGASASAYNLTLAYGGGTGTVNIGGSGSAVTVGNATALGSASSSITLSDGGTLTTAALSGSGFLNLAGGTLRSGGTLSSSLGATLTNASFVDTNGYTTTLSGNLTGSGSLTKSGAGTLTLAGSNDYSGGTTVSAGTLAGNTTSLQGNIANNAALTFDQASTGTYAGTLSGTGSLTKTGSGNLTLSGTNSYSGGTTVSAGTLTVANDANLGATSGALTANSGATVNTGGYYGTNRATSLDGSGTSLVNNGELIIGFGGTGSLALTNDATVSAYNLHLAYTGGTGTVDIGSGASVNVSGTTSLWTGSSTLNLNDGGTLTTPGLSGSGTLNLAGGTLRAGGALSTGVATTLTDDSTVNTNGYATTLSGSLSGSGSLTKSGSGTLTLSGANGYTGGTTVSAGTLQLDSAAASSAYAITSGATLDLHVASGTQDHTADTTLSGTGTLRKTGAGNAAWSTAAATFAMDSGALIDVQAGTLTGGSGANENWTANLADLNVATGATFAGVEANVRVDALSGAGTITSGYNGAGYSTFTFGVDNGSGTFSGVLADTDGSNAGHFTKVGSGTQVLTGTNTSTGGTTVTGGTLQLGDGTSTGSVAGDIVNNANVVFNRSDDYTYAGVISGTGSVTQDGYILRLSAPQTYTGATAVKSGSYLVLATTADQGLAAATTVDLESGSFFDISNHATEIAGLTGAGRVYSFGGSDGHLTVNTANGQDQTFSGVLGGASHADFALTKAGDGSLALTGANTYSGGTTVSGGTLSGNTSSLQGNITNHAAVVFDQDSAGTYSGAITGTGSLTKTGSGTLTLSGTSDFTGGTTVYAGTLRYGAASALTGTSSLDVASGASLDLNDNAITIADLDGAGNITLGSGSLTTGDSNDHTLSGIISGTGSLTKTGSGTLTLSGTNTYSGDTTLNGGTVATTSRTNLGSGDLTINAGTLDATGNYVFENDTVVTGADSTLTTSGYVEWGTSGTGSLTVANGAQVTSGATTAFGNQAAGNGSATVTGTDSTLTSAGALYVGISGTGALTIADGGTVSAPAVFVGVYGSSSGTLNLNAGGKLQTSVIASEADTADFNFNGGELEIVGSNFSSGETFTLGDGTSTTIDTNGFNAAFTGTLGGSGGITKDGAGTMTLSGTNSFTGTATISGGTLALGADATIANSSGVALGTGGILDLTAKSGGFAFGAGQTLSGTGTVNLASGQTLDFAGTLAPGNSPGITTVDGNLVLNSAAIIAMELAGSGGVAGTDFDQLVVTGALTLGGTLQVSLFDDYVPSIGQSFQLFNASSIGGSFAAYTLPTIEGASWNTSQLASTGMLSLSAVPEPSTYALIVGIAFLALAIYRRRRT